MKFWSWTKLLKLFTFFLSQLVFTLKPINKYNECLSSNVGSKLQCFLSNQFLSQIINVCVSHSTRAAKTPFFSLFSPHCAFLPALWAHTHRIRNAFFSLFSTFWTVGTHKPLCLFFCLFLVGVSGCRLTYQILLKIRMGLSNTSESIHTDPPIIKWSDLIKHTLFLVAIKSAKQRIHVKTLNQVCHKNS